MKLKKQVITAGICAGVSLALFTGCSSKPEKLDPNEVVATMGDQNLTLGVANLMYRFAQVQTGQYIRMLLGDDGSNIWEQDLIGYGTPYGLSLKDSAMSEYEQMIILEQHMGEYNVEITDEEKSAITAAATKFLADNDPATLEQMTATQETVERLLTLYTIEEKMEKAVRATAEIEVTDEEAAQKKIRYAYFAIPEPEAAEEETEADTEAVSEKTTEAESEEATEAVSEKTTEAESEEATEAVSETETEEGFEETPERIAARAEVQALIDEIIAGGDMEEVVKAYDEEKNVIENHYGAGTTTLSQTLIDAAEALADGETTAAPVEVENGFYIVQMMDTFDEEATAQEKEEMIEEGKDSFYQEKLDSWEPEDFAIVEEVWEKVKYYDDFRVPVAEAESEEAESEEATEAVTEAGTEGTTEAVTEAVTEAGTEGITETETEGTTEAVTEEATEAVSETETES